MAKPVALLVAVASCFMLAGCQSPLCDSSPECNADPGTSSMKLAPGQCSEAGTLLVTIKEYHADPATLTLELHSLQPTPLALGTLGIFGKAGPDNATLSNYRTYREPRGEDGRTISVLQPYGNATLTWRLGSAPAAPWSAFVVQHTNQPLAPATLENRLTALCSLEGDHAPDAFAIKPTEAASMPVPVQSEPTSSTPVAAPKASSSPSSAPSTTSPPTRSAVPFHVEDVRVEAHETMAKVSWLAVPADDPMAREVRVNFTGGPFTCMCPTTPGILNGRYSSDLSTLGPGETYHFTIYDYTKNGNTYSAHDLYTGTFTTLSSSQGLEVRSLQVSSPAKQSASSATCFTFGFDLVGRGTITTTVHWGPGTSPTTYPGAPNLQRSFSYPNPIMAGHQSGSTCDIPLAPGATHYAYVEATNSYGEHVTSPITTFQVSTDPYPPFSDVSITFPDNRSATVQWTLHGASDPVADVYFGATDSLTRFLSMNGNEWTQSGTDMRFTVHLQNVLQPGTTYHYRLYGFIRDDGALSNDATFQTPA